jgi:hypothetical protein
MRRVADMLKAYWAYDFVCDRPIEAILTAFNQAGPWQWEPRESAVYGDYLNSHPLEGVRVRVHQYPQMGEYGVFIGLRDKGFSALLQVDAECAATRSAVDDAFRSLLQRINATDMTEIEAYD